MLKRIALTLLLLAGLLSAGCGLFNRNRCSESQSHSCPDQNCR